MIDEYGKRFFSVLDEPNTPKSMADRGNGAGLVIRVTTP